MWQLCLPSTPRVRPLKRFLMLAGRTALGETESLPGPARVSSGRIAAAETPSVLVSLERAHASAGCTAAAKIHPGSVEIANVNTAWPL